MKMLKRFTDKIKKTKSCWIWQGALNSKGYGQFSFNCKQVSAHRFIYEQVVGKIPDGLTIDHLCRNKSCVNPAHLEAVTLKENNRRVPESPTTINALKTHCKRGHSFSGNNLRLEKNKHGFGRVCRECKNILKRQYRAEGRMA